MRQLKTLGCGLELVLWALWLGALWSLALWIAPSLFKWLPRPEAGLVAGRLFYMMSWGSMALVVVLPLLALLNVAAVGMGEFGRAASGPQGRHFVTNYLLNALFVLRWPMAVLLVVMVAVVVELWCIHPYMRGLRQSIAVAGPELAQALKADFARMHAYSTTVYALKMVAVLVWGLLRYNTQKLFKPN